MAEKPESRLQKKMQKRFRLRGAAVIKVHGGLYSSGIPDLLACYRGIFVACEVKTPQNKKGATKLQRGVLKSIRRAGGYAYVIREEESVDRILDAIDRRIDG